MTTETQVKKEKAVPFIRRNFPSIEVAKGSRPPLGIGEPSGIFRSPDQKAGKTTYAEIKIKQVDFTWMEAKELAEQIELFTGWVMLEYSNGEGFYADIKAMPPRQRYSFTLKQADEEIDELKTKNAELNMRLDLATKLVKACTPIAMNTAMYKEMGGNLPFHQWLLTSTCDELESRKKMLVILEDKRWKGISTK